MNTDSVAGIPFEFWSNVLPSATGCLHLTEEVVGTRSGVAVAEQKRFLRNHPRNAERAEACKAKASQETRLVLYALSRRVIFTVSSHGGSKINA